jgi:succinate dehydrogenase / fumarate reductase, cytochrome b subunit
MTFKEMFISSIGKKLVMAFTGLFLILFLVVHLAINATVFANMVDAADNGNMYNKAAHFMGSTVLIRIMEIGLFLGLLLHIVQGLMLEMQNRSARKSKYIVNQPSANSKWYSRYMGILGILILAFLILHLFHFWVKARFSGGIPDVVIGGSKMHNMYALMDTVFQNEIVILVYVLGCFAVAWHLVHGFQSAFRTVGVSNQKYLNLAKSLGIGFSIIVPLIFALIPIAYYFDILPPFVG